MHTKKTPHRWKVCISKLIWIPRPKKCFQTPFAQNISDTGFSSAFLFFFFADLSPHFQCCCNSSRPRYPFPPLCRKGNPCLGHKMSRYCVQNIQMHLGLWSGVHNKPDNKIIATNSFPYIAISLQTYLLLWKLYHTYPFLTKHSPVDWFLIPQIKWALFFSGGRFHMLKMVPPRGSYNGKLQMGQWQSIKQ